MKMNTLLAVADQKMTRYTAMLGDYLNFFKKNQGQFKGIRKTFNVREGFVDQPNMRENTAVVTTVDEKFNWFIDRSSEYLDDQFTIEATNSLGAKKVSLVVDGVQFGEMTALELMRLKSILTNSTLDNIFKEIPVRSEVENWLESEDSNYKGRSIYESDLNRGTTKTTTKTSRILPDPNIDKLKDSSKYTPQVVQDEKQEITGDYTYQQFSGEWSHLQRAELQRRKSLLLDAVVKALKEVNDIEVASSEFNSTKMLKYLINGEK